jgi:hypothetical protein
MPFLRISPLIASLFALVAGACATSPSATEGAAQQPGAPSAPAAPVAENMIPVTVNYNMPDQGQLTVYIEPTGGIRSVLGIIQPNENKTFNFRVSGSRNIKLDASSDAGGTIRSPAITVPTGQGVIWDLALNNMRIRR